MSNLLSEVDRYKMIDVRQIKSMEWQLLRSVRLAALADTPEAFGETLDHARRRDDVDWQKRAKEGAEGERSFCCLAFEDEETRGMAVGLPDTTNPHLSYLVAMWVSPLNRGGGVGSKLVDCVAQWARNQGATELIAGVSCGNDRADRFYRKIGFQEYEGGPLTHPAADGCATVLSMSLTGSR